MLRGVIGDEWLPFAISMGVSEKEFWELGPRGLEPYIKAYQLREKQRLEHANVQGWLIGIYVTHAIGCMLSEGASYPDKPIDIFGNEVSDEERLRMEAEMFAAYAAEYNRQMRKEVDEVAKGE